MKNNSNFSATLGFEKSTAKANFIEASGWCKADIDLFSITDSPNFASKNFSKQEQAPVVRMYRDDCTSTESKKRIASRTVEVHFSCECVSIPVFRVRDIFH